MMVDKGIELTINFFGFHWGRGKLLVSAVLVGEKKKGEAAKQDTRYAM